MVIALQLWKMFLNLNFTEFFFFAKNNAGTDYSPHCTNPQNRIQRAFETLSCSDFAAPKPAGSFAGGKFWKRSCKEVRRMGRRGFKFKTLTSTKAIPPSTQALTLRCFAKRFYSNLIGRARVAQWWEHPPPTNLARVRILASTPYVGWICCWFSPLLWEVFLYSGFPHSLKTNTSKFQFDLERTDTFQRVPKNSYVFRGKTNYNNYNNL